MEPVEINAGGWYLRALRDDGRVDDRPALAALRHGDPGDGGIDRPTVAALRAGWADETLLSWAVCVPTTGELVALVTVALPEGDAAVLTASARPGFEQAAADGEAAVRRFCAGALGVEPA